MPLIACPNCGKSISDSAQTCVHCGYKLKEEPKNFYALPLSNQEKLQSEYRLSGGTFPQDYTKERRSYIKKLKIIIWCMVYPAFAVIGFLSITFLLKAKFSAIAVIIAVILLSLCGILAIPLIKTIKKHKADMQKMITDRVAFEKWLDNAHNITITWEWGTATQYYIDYKNLKQKEGMK